MSDNGKRSHDLDPEIITDVDEEDVYKSFTERTDGRYQIPRAALLAKEEAQNFSPMLWPMMDDGKPLSTNAIGYPTGGWYALQKKALEEKQAREAEEKRRAEEEAQKAEEEAQKDQVLTAEELEAIRQAAYEEGFQQGRQDGHAEGLVQGQEEGRQQGYAQGFEEGKNSGREAGVKLGREEGFQQGQREGLESGRELVESKVTRFAHLGDMLANPLRELNRDVTDEICYLISRLASVIIHRELKGEAENLKSAIDKCLELLPNAQKGATIVLCEEDHDLVLAALGRDYLKAQHWILEVSADLQPGDVEVYNDVSLADFKVNERIDDLLDKFLTEAAQVSDAALRESIPEAPEYNEMPPKPLAPPPDLLMMEKSIARHLGEEQRAAPAQDPKAAASQMAAPADGSIQIADDPFAEGAK